MGIPYLKCNDPGDDWRPGWGVDPKYIYLYTSDAASIIKAGRGLGNMLLSNRTGGHFCLSL